MKGDFSRFTFDPSKHFSAVRLQQGRVQLDADWNEQLDITAHRIETEITDFIGQSGAPDTSAGFAIQLAAGAGSLTVGHGRYYVDGMLFELDADASFSAQPDFPGAVLPTTDGRYLAYLDAWQCHLSALDDPRILEPALGDAETATRIRNLAQVKLQLLTEKDSKDPKDYLPPWQPNWDLAIGTGALAARVSAPQATLENQLYRVEIHQGGGADKATFKWSRDNGSVGARVKGINGQVITLRAGGPGAQTRFAANQWVEVITQAQTLRGESGVLAELAAVQVDELTVSRWPNNVVPIADGSVVVRRWDSSPGEIAVKAGPIPLEDGIEVNFDTGVTARYKAGDYWLIPARNLTGNVEWPRNADQSPLSVHPHGVVHHYCALALLTLSKGKWSVDSDLRVLFKPIATGLVSKGGDTVTGSLSVLGNVGIGTTVPQARLHVQGDATAQGSGASSVPPALCRMTDGTGALQFLVSPKGDVDARGKLSVGDVEVRGRLSVSAAAKPLSVPGAAEDLRIVRGNVKVGARTPPAQDTVQPVAGTGFVVGQVQNASGPQPGLYDITFAPPFSGRPSASVTVVHQDDFVEVTGEQQQEFDNLKGNPSQNAIIMAITSEKMRVKTGDEKGNAIGRRFSFIVIGPR